MSNILENVIFPLDLLSQDPGMRLWSDATEATLAHLLWAVVRGICARERSQGGRIHAKEQADLESIAFDGLRWLLRRYQDTEDKYPQNRNRWAAVFLLGCLLRAEMADDIHRAALIGAWISALGYRRDAIELWQAALPLRTRDERTDGGRVFLSKNRPGPDDRLRAAG